MQATKRRNETMKFSAKLQLICYVKHLPDIRHSKSSKPVNERDLSLNK